MDDGSVSEPSTTVEDNNMMKAGGKITAAVEGVEDVNAVKTPFKRKKVQEMCNKAPHKFLIFQLIQFEGVIFMKLEN